METSSLEGADDVILYGGCTLDAPITRLRGKLTRAESLMDEVC